MWTKELAEQAKSELTPLYVQDWMKRTPAKAILDKDGNPTGSFRSPFGRLIYADLFTPMKMRDAAPDKEPEYSVTMAFPPGTDLTPLREGAAAAARLKFGDKVNMRTLRSPFREQSTKDKPGFLSDGFFMRASARKNEKPEVVDLRMQPITDASEIYRGAWGLMTFRFGCYDQAGNKGVGVYLSSVVKICDDLPLAGGSNVRAEDAFADLLGDAASGAGDTNYDSMM